MKLTYQQRKFISDIKSSCIHQMKLTKLFASVIGANAIYESNYGTGDVMAATHNLYHLQPDDKWLGAVYDIDKEQSYPAITDTEPNSRLICIYKDYNECIEAYAKYITETRRSINGPLKYKAAIEAKDYTACVNGLIRCGYQKDHLFTYNDPSYKSNIISIIESNELYKWDEEAKDTPLNPVQYSVKKDADGKSIFSSSLKENASKVARDNRGYKVFDSDGNMVEDAWAPNKDNIMYRVRRDWEAETSQLIATMIYQDAVSEASSHPGYKVYKGDEGELVLDPWEKKPVLEPEKIKSIKPLYKGCMMNVTNVPVYRSATDNIPFHFISGKVFQYDGVIYNGRVRITNTNNPKVLGRDPSKIYGYIDF